MTPFLSQVAQVYLDNEREELMDYCFVFPNKRSGTFFRHYLHTLSKGKPLGMPEIATIGDLTARLSSLVEAPRLEQLFVLYDCYRSLGGDTIDFDRFLFWGEMILSDFNDVDLYLVDHERLFVNLKRYREVSANYLTDEQRAILERYWGEQFAAPSPDRFWEHLHYDSPTELEQKFLKLWEVLAPLYESFTSALRRSGVGTQGMIVREAVGKLRKCSTSDLTHRRYIFVGFNILTLAELSMFENLDVRGVADFYWDNASPAMKVKGNAAARFIDRNVRKFKSRYDLARLFPFPDNYFPEIQLTGIPSSVGQAKMAGVRLDEWVKADPSLKSPESLDTAVVLPDDSLLIPMIHSVPTEIKQLNVTMGLPMRTTSFASLINLLVSMHMHASVSNGECSYYYDDVKRVITHPLLASIDRKGCEALMELFMNHRIYMLPAETARATAPSLAYIFTPISDPDSLDEVYGYFHTLLTTLKAGVTSVETDEANDIEVFFINAYLEALDDLRDAAGKWKISLNDNTFIQLLQKVISGASVSFTGEPLRGLQIMGVLETRALDFSNLILLSMNERIFPRKHYTRSFIPDSLRHSYGMATTDYQESIYAYYFYRLISRARRVSIFYDSRNGPTFTSEMSRYIIQLLYLHPECKITHTLGSYEVTPATPQVISISRTPEIKEQLLSFCTPGGRKLSASSINTYINCSLQFYLQRICGLNTDEEAKDYMDSATYGTILHAVAQRVYLRWRGDAQSVKVTAEMLDDIITSHTILDGLIIETVNEIFNKRPAGDRTPLVGEAKVMGNLIRYFLTRMFEMEKEIAPFDFIDAEHVIDSTMRLADDLTINFTQSLDRIDRVYPPGHYGDPTQGTIRIVDYKTGIDKTDFKSIDELFADPESSADHRRKAILQLMFYARAYAEKFRYEGPIQPLIYPLRTIYATGLQPLKYGKDPFTDYREVIDEFMTRFEAVVREMLLSDKPFTQTDNEENCTFCTFKTLCRRQ
ncbi:MAG: PD-(D/E)XK nuclease family protein [Duncaniella sp.]|nr:PD-(D/E)XK nuclease family protein [Duncaniella sp.]